MLKPLPLSEPTLEETLENLYADDASLSYYQLQGFLFAICCSPEPVRASDWFDLIWHNDDPCFDNQVDARRFFRQVIDLADYIEGSIAQRRFLPFDGEYSDRCQWALAQWCEGLLMGHNYLDEIWLMALDDLDDHQLDDQIDAVLSLASTFVEISADHQLSFGDEMALTEKHLPEAYRLFQVALKCYAGVAESWATTQSREIDAEQLFLLLDPVDRHQPCPCGSGLLFAKCCLH